MRTVITLLFSTTITFLFTSCFGNSSDMHSTSSKYVEDDKYWESIQRQQLLEKASMDDAAIIVKHARQEYMQGGGYTAPDGTKQIHFQGSKEQAEQLKMMDELGW